MCGIFGILNHTKLDKNKFSKSLELLNHRGPDNYKSLHYPTFSFGFTRLAILELSEHGNQPMKSLKTGNIIILNGEIYNFPELKKILKRHGVIISSNSDVEALLAFYDFFGIHKTLESAEGMFAFAIYDKKLNKVFLARDSFGQKPLFFSKQDKGFIFASEIKSILKYIGNAELDLHSSLNPLFTTGLPPRGKTCFSNIFSLDPGNFIEYSLNTKRFSIKKFFSIETLVDRSLYQELDNLSESEISSRLSRLIHNSVKTHMIADAPLGSLFSLGLDSTIISKIAGDYKDINLYHFLGEMDVTKPHLKKYQDLFNPNISIVKEKESDLYRDFPKMLYHYEMPNKLEGSALSLLCKQAKSDGHKAMLTGDAADEIFGGYGHHKEFLSQCNAYHSAFKRNFSKIYKHIFPGGLISVPDSNPLGLAYNTAPFSQNLDEVSHNLIYHSGSRLKEWTNAINAYDFINNKAEKFSSAYLLDEVGYRLERFLIRGDRFGMMNSIELRNPFLDKRLISFAMNIPIRYRIKRSLLKGYETKSILKRVGLLNGLPKSLVYRGKVGTPLVVDNFYNAIISKINFDGIENLLKINQNDIKYALLNSYDKDLDRMKYSFIAFETLHKLFIENKSYSDIGEEFNSYK